jgi:hypothetical protein
MNWIKPNKTDSHIFLWLRKRWYWLILAAWFITLMALFIALGG